MQGLGFRGLGYVGFKGEGLRVEGFGLVYGGLLIHWDSVLKRKGSARFPSLLSGAVVQQTQT